MSELFVEPAPEAETQSADDMEQQEKGSMQAEDAGAFAVSAGDFSALEERVVRAVALVKQERQARAAAEEKVVQAEARADERAATIEQMEAELTTLRSERDHVRRRVESLLQQLDALEL